MNDLINQQMWSRRYTIRQSGWSIFLNLMESEKGNPMNKILKALLPVILILPIMANAEIYKWKDDKGNSLYSDVPPPSNVPSKVISSKKAAATPAPQVAPKDQSAVKKPPVSREEEASKRQQSAEETKKKDQAKEAELKQKQANCANAKSNYQIHKQGGRIYKMNEKGEREYLSDADLAKGIEQAQKDMDTFCSE